MRHTCINILSVDTNTKSLVLQYFPSLIFSLKKAKLQTYISAFMNKQY